MIDSSTFIFILFFAGLFAGTVDAVAGGGGLISLPMLLGVGIPPHVALGTNKFQSIFGTGMATYQYYKNGLFYFKEIWVGLLTTFLGSFIGAIVVQYIAPSFLKEIMPFLLLIILLYSLFSPRLGLIDTHPRISKTLFYVTFGLALGFYDGFFGPGVGSFWLFFLIYFLGFNLVKATAHTKILNLNTNVAALLCFIFNNQVDYKIGLFMAAGQLIGGRLGAHLVMVNGVKLVKPIFLLVVTGTILTLVYRAL